jgi:hypothetical protein
VTGKRVQVFPVQSNAAQIEAMPCRRLEAFSFNISDPLSDYLS